MNVLSNSIDVNMYIEGILFKIYNNSIQKDNKINEEILNKYINLLRQYLRMAIEIGFINCDNFEKIKSNLEKIGYFELTESESFGAHGMVSSKDGHVVFKDSNMKNEVDTVIFAFHEFFHALAGLSNQMAKNLSDNLSVLMDLLFSLANDIDVEKIYDVDKFELPLDWKCECGFGFVIDDCFAQESAEILAYKYLSMDRPKENTGKFEELLGDIQFKSRWSEDCFYRVFYESFINVMGNDIHKLITSCFNGDFINNFFNRCNNKEEMIALLQIFKNWFYLISSIYYYMTPYSCFTDSDKNPVTYSKDFLIDAVRISNNESEKFKKFTLNK